MFTKVIHNYMTTNKELPIFKYKFVELVYNTIVWVSVHFDSFSHLFFFSFFLF